MTYFKSGAFRFKLQFAGARSFKKAKCSFVFSRKSFLIPLPKTMPYFILRERQMVTRQILFPNDSILSV